MSLLRLQKIIAMGGVASRRKAEELITEGKVRVNGKIVTRLGEKADPSKDRIEVENRRVVTERHITILLNKPRGVVSTVKDPEGRPTVVELVKTKKRIFPVGRLDWATSGVLILTNDGKLTQALTHPGHGAQKEYHLKIRGKIKNEILDKWRNGIRIDGKMTMPAIVKKLKENDRFTWISVTLSQGRNRQIRKMSEQTRLEVQKLKRVSFAGLTVEGLKPGQYRDLTAKEITKLKKQFSENS